MESRRQPEQQPRPLPLSVTSRPNAEADPLPKNVREILAIPRDQRTPEQTQAVFSYWRTTVPEWKRRNDADRDAVEASIRKARRSWCCKTREDGRETHILKRGDFLQPGKVVTPGSRRSCIRCRRTLRRTG